MVWYLEVPRARRAPQSGQSLTLGATTHRHQNLRNVVGPEFQKKKRSWHWPTQRDHARHRLPYSLVGKFTALAEYIHTVAQKRCRFNDRYRLQIVTTSATHCSTSLSWSPQFKKSASRHHTRGGAFLWSYDDDDDDEDTT